MRKEATGKTTTVKKCGGWHCCAIPKGFFWGGGWVVKTGWSSETTTTNSLFFGWPLQFGCTFGSGFAESKNISFQLFCPILNVFFISMSLRERTLNAVRKSFFSLASCAYKPRKGNNHKMQQQGAMRKRQTEKGNALFVLFWIREFRRVPPTFPQKWRHHIVRYSKKEARGCWTERH